MKNRFQIQFLPASSSRSRWRRPRDRLAPDQVYFTSLRTFSPTSSAPARNVTYKKVQLDAVESQRLQHRLGYSPSKTSYRSTSATSGGRVDGYAFIDEEKGEHLPITFAVKLSPDGKVLRQEIVRLPARRAATKCATIASAAQFARQERPRRHRDRSGHSGRLGREPSRRARWRSASRRAVVLFDELGQPSAVVNRQSAVWSGGSSPPAAFASGNLSARSQADLHLLRPVLARRHRSVSMMFYEDLVGAEDGGRGRLLRGASHRSAAASPAAGGPQIEMPRRGGDGPEQITGGR